MSDVRCDFLPISIYLYIDLVAVVEQPSKIAFPASLKKKILEYNN